MLTITTWTIDWALSDVDGITADFGRGGYHAGDISHYYKPPGSLPGWGPTVTLSNAPDWYVVTPPQDIPGGMFFIERSYPAATLEQAYSIWDAQCPNQPRPAVREVR